MRVSSWSQFVGALEEVLDGYNEPPTYVFRGQADAAWLLEPSLARRLRDVFDRASAHAIEQHLEDEFKAQAALFPETKTIWPFLVKAGQTKVWALMQHRSCATRLLDWTASAFVAAYFAVNELPKKNGALFVVAPPALKKYVGLAYPTWDGVSDRLLASESAPDLGCSRGRAFGRVDQWRNRDTSVLEPTFRRLHERRERHVLLRIMRPVDAFDENGLLRPVSDLPLRSGERVRVIVVRGADASRWDSAKLAAHPDDDLALAVAGLDEWAAALEREERE